MKRLLAVVVAFVSVAALAQGTLVAQHENVIYALNTENAVATPVAQRAEREQPDPAKITVYVTRTGEKYHRDGCRYLSRSKIPMSLKEAAKRFGPCSVCKPPTLK